MLFHDRKGKNDMIIMKRRNPMEEKRKEEKEQLNEKELLKKIEKAASRGASKGSIRNILLSSLPTLLVLALLAYLIIPKVDALHNGLKSFFHFDEPLSDHDATIENHGIFGYKAADFEEAILGDATKLRKLEVYQQEISDVAEITDTGLLNWGIFTRNQLITYNGTVVYTVDLSSLKSSDIRFDEESKIITLFIPHAIQEEINIPEDKIQFSDTTKGLLAFGDIKMTMEQASQVQSETRDRMQQKLDEQKVQETADRFAKLSVWELYSPIIKGVAKDYSLEVVFKD